MEEEDYSSVVVQKTEHEWDDYSPIGFHYLDDKCMVTTDVTPHKISIEWLKEAQNRAKQIPDPKVVYNIYHLLDKIIVEEEESVERMTYVAPESTKGLRWNYVTVSDYLKDLSIAHNFEKP